MKIPKKIERRFRNFFIWLLYKIDKEQDEDDLTHVGHYLKPRFWKLKRHAHIGFCWSGTMDLSKGTSYWIFELQVFKPFQGRGFGGYLLIRVLQDCRKYGFPIYLGVKPGGAAGKSLTYDQLKKFYLSYGFVENIPGGGCLVFKGENAQ